MSGAMMTMLLGGGDRVVLNPIAADHATITPTNASAGFTLQTDGTITYNAGNSFNPDAVTWFSGAPRAGIGNNYWCRLNVVSGSVSTGTTGSILALSSARSWTRQQTTVGVSTFSGTLQIFADAGGTILVASTTVNLTAEES